MVTPLPPFTSKDGTLEAKDLTSSRVTRLEFVTATPLTTPRRWIATSWTPVRVTVGRPVVVSSPASQAVSLLPGAMAPRKVIGLSGVPEWVSVTFSS